MTTMMTRNRWSDDVRPRGSNVSGKPSPRENLDLTTRSVMRARVAVSEMADSRLPDHHRCVNSTGTPQNCRLS